jgi:Family of unknown function (DUF6459)
MPPPKPTSSPQPRPADPGAERSAALPLVPGIERPPARMRPLPDAESIRVLAVPDSAPPYDGEALAADGPCGAAAGPEPQPAGQQPGPRSSQGPGTDGPGPQRAGPPGDAAAAWPGRFAQVLAETLAGSRSQGQIVPWTSAAARRRIRQLGPMLTAGAAPRIRRVVTMRPAADVVEMTVVVGFGERVRALAIRLERDRQRHPGPADPQWVCTAIEAA